MKTIYLIIVSMLFNMAVIAQKTELYASLDQAVGNIAYTKTGQLVFSHHPFFKPEIRVATYNEKTKKVIPFPNKEWNIPKINSDLYLDDVLGIRNDKDGIVWMLDMGTRSNITPKLVGWNTKTNQLERIYYIPAPTTLNTSQPNDFVIDSKHHVFVIADEDIARGGDGSQAALVIVDMKTGKTRRVLQGRESTRADINMPIVIDDSVLGVTANGIKSPIFVGADGITLDNNNEWLYYAPLCGNKLYRLKMTDLLNEKLTDDELDRKVEVYSEKRNNGGLSIDIKGNIYLTNIESQSIGFIDAKTKEYSVFSQNKQMLWPDGISYNKDGYMYVSAAQVHLGTVFNNAENKTSAPFYIFRFKPVAEGIFGR